MDGDFALDAGETVSAEAFVEYITKDLAEIAQLWPAELESTRLQDIHDCLAQKQPQFITVVEAAVSAGDELDDHYGSVEARLAPAGVADLLHPTVVQSSYAQFRGGHYRDAVVNAIVGVFDLLRTRSGLDLDGVDLVGRSLSLQHPALILSDLETESGRNEQKGFLQLLQGAYVGIRNPKAHTLSTDLDQIAAAQYLVFASLLARRISAAVEPEARTSVNVAEEAQNPPAGADG